MRQHRPMTSGCYSVRFEHASLHCSSNCRIEAHSVWWNLDTYLGIVELWPHTLRILRKLWLRTWLLVAAFPSGSSPHLSAAATSCQPYNIFPRIKHVIMWPSTSPTEAWTAIIALHLMEWTSLTPILPFTGSVMCEYLGCTARGTQHL